MMVSLSSHSIWRGTRARPVRAHGSPPCGFINQICDLERLGFGSGRPRVLTKAISLLSGDQRGSVLLSAPRVSWISVLSVMLERNRFETRASLSLSAVDLTQTTHLPSGETRNCAAVSP